VLADEHTIGRLDQRWAAVRLLEYAPYAERTPLPLGEPVSTVREVLRSFARARPRWRGAAGHPRGRGAGGAHRRGLPPLGGERRAGHSQRARRL